ncbi:MAG: rod shape-determining protein MreD [Nitrospirae bacterium]|nr:rod shape-determining protein MreD [Nitrospirota bacterium]
MRKAVLIFIIFSAFLIESRASVFGVRPDLATAIVYYFGLRNGEVKGMLFGSFIGFVGDSLSGNILGPNILGKGLVGLFSSFMSGSFFRWTPLSGAIGLFLLTVLGGTIVFLSRTMFEQMPTSVMNAVYTILISAVINSIPGIFLKPRNE